MNYISIIIPAYNVDLYISKCLDSIVAQLYKKFEVIVVNDGSVDNTLSICNSYVSKIPNMKIITTTNHGMAHARNLGTSIALGDYVCYIDSDDWIAPNFLSELYNQAAKNNFPDIVQCGYCYSFESYQLIHKDFVKGNNSSLLTSEEALNELFRQRKIKNFPWGKIIRRKIAQDNLFPIIPNFEDSHWFFKLVNQCKTYLVLSEPLYYYRQRENSMTSSFNTSSIYLLQGYHLQYKFAQEMFPNLVPVILNTYMIAFFNINCLAKKQGREIYSLYKTYLKKEISHEFNSILKKVSITTKIKLISLKYNFFGVVCFCERIITRIFKSNEFIMFKNVK